MDELYRLKKTAQNVYFSARDQYFPSSKEYIKNKKYEKRLLILEFVVLIHKLWRTFSVRSDC